MMIRTLRLLALVFFWLGAGLAVAGVTLAGEGIWWIGVGLAVVVGILGLSGSDRRIPV
jgi:hypothetical protein